MASGSLLLIHNLHRLVADILILVEHGALVSIGDDAVFALQRTGEYLQVQSRAAVLLLQVGFAV